MTTRKAAPSSGRGVEFAWRTHGAITDWTAKVDSKASIVLSLGGVLLGFCLTLSMNGRLLSGFHGWQLQLERFGFALISLGVVLSALVVAPRLNRRTARQNWHDNYVYFGHLRRWKVQDLKKRLQSLTEDEELDVLSTQLVATSKIAWFKHSCLQWAMCSMIVGVVLLVVAVRG